MYIVKSLEDYSKTPLEKKLTEFLVKKTSGICFEKIKNNPSSGGNPSSGSMSSRFI